MVSVPTKYEHLYEYQAWKREGGRLLPISKVYRSYIAAYMSIKSYTKREIPGATLKAEAMRRKLAKSCCVARRTRGMDKDWHGTTHISRLIMEGPQHAK